MSKFDFCITPRITLSTALPISQLHHYIHMQYHIRTQNNIKYMQVSPKLDQRSSCAEINSTIFQSTHLHKYYPILQQ